MNFQTKNSENITKHIFVFSQGSNKDNHNDRKNNVVSVQKTVISNYMFTNIQAKILGKSGKSHNSFVQPFFIIDAYYKLIVYDIRVLDLGNWEYG